MRGALIVSGPWAGSASGPGPRRDSLSEATELQQRYFVPQSGVTISTRSASIREGA
jgi:hypothetical protein